MQVVDCLVHIGGDLGNCVPRVNVTAAELALLCEIHGYDAVREIDVKGDAQDFDAVEERQRLAELYGAAKCHDDKEQSALVRLYPGANPRLFTRVDEIGLADICFKAARPKQKSGAKAKPHPMDAGAQWAAALKANGGKPPAAQAAGETGSILT